MHVDNVTQSGDYWIIQGSELKTATNDGQIIKVRTIKVDNETPRLRGTQNKTIIIKGGGPDTLMTSDGQIIKVIFHKVDSGSNRNSFISRLP